MRVGTEVKLAALIFWSDVHFLELILLKPSHESPEIKMLKDAVHSTSLLLVTD